jgi:hypothetical protein
MNGETAVASLFGDLDITTINEIPEDGTHKFIVWKFKTFESKAGRTYLTVEHRLSDTNSPVNGFNVRKLFWLPNHDDFEEDATGSARAINDYRIYMRAIGVPEEEMDNPTFSDYTGLEVLIYGKGRDTKMGKEWSFFPANVRQVS